MGVSQYSWTPRSSQMFTIQELEIMDDHPKNIEVYIGFGPLPFDFDMSFIQLMNDSRLLSTTCYRLSLGWSSRISRKCINSNAYHLCLVGTEWEWERWKIGKYICWTNVIHVFSISCLSWRTWCIECIGCIEWQMDKPRHRHRLGVPFMRGYDNNLSRHVSCCKLWMLDKSRGFWKHLWTWVMMVKMRP